MKRLALVTLGVALVASQVLATDTAPPAVVKAFNDDIDHVWDHLRPLAEQRAKREASTQLVGKSFSKAKVTKVRDVRLQLANAPGFKKIATNRLELALPLQGTWAIAVDVDVELDLPLLGKRTAPVTVEVRDLKVAAGVTLDDKNPTNLKVKKVDTPELTFHVSVSSSKAGLGQVLSVLSLIGDFAAHRLAKNALDDLAPKLAGLKGTPGPLPASTAPILTDSMRATPFATIVANVDRRIRRDHLPHGTIVETKLDVPTFASWLDDYGPQGAGNPGSVTAFHGTGDSAIWTGHYLASQALRWKATGDAEALDNVRLALEGIGNLLDVNGGTGLLARIAAPEASPIGQDILTRDRPVHATIRGVAWVGRQGGDGITRDQYSGVFFGLGYVLDNVQDPAVQAEAGRRVVQMVDYLVACDWIIDEDRITFAQPGGSFPTIWAGSALQRLHFLLLAERVAPGRYAKLIQKLSPIARVEWLSQFADNPATGSYFKYNLAHVNYDRYFQLETDPQRWQDMARAFRILRAKTERHRNPHFDLIATHFDPSLSATFHSAVREELRQFLERPHREVSPQVVDLSGVRWETLKIPGANGVKKVTMPAEPLEARLRERCGTFLWQSSPFEPAVVGKGDAKSEALGIDLVLPYWMGKVAGAF